ncbi:hypothetical protein FB451DRAFT_1196108 [Mycena latifolia]|nr:hypothetical protein FB451DRAFT_1196108 [Mycena latifolia]
MFLLPVLHGPTALPSVLGSSLQAPGVHFIAFKHLNQLAHLDGTLGSLTTSALQHQFRVLNAPLWFNMRRRRVVPLLIFFFFNVCAPGEPPYAHYALSMHRRREATPSISCGICANRATRAPATELEPLSRSQKRLRHEGPLPNSLFNFYVYHEHSGALLMQCDTPQGFTLLAAPPGRSQPAHRAAPEISIHIPTYRYMPHAMPHAGGTKHRAQHFNSIFEVPVTELMLKLYATVQNAAAVLSATLGIFYSSFGHPANCIRGPSRCLMRWWRVAPPRALGFNLGLPMAHVAPSVLPGAAVARTHHYEKIVVQLLGRISGASRRSPIFYSAFNPPRTDLQRMLHILNQFLALPPRQ